MSRWSARRAAVQAEVDADDRAAKAVIVADQQAEKSDAEILTELNLKDPDDLIKGDDFSAFMQAAVPQRIRKRALRKLWLSNPVLANVDNLLDYGEDFAAESKLGLVVKTSYQVGKGLLAHVQEMEKQALAEEEISEPEEIEEVVEVIADEPAEPTPEIEEEVEETPIKRRMRFRFAS